MTDKGRGEYETNLVRSFAQDRPAKLLAVSRYAGVNAMRIAASPSRLVLLDQDQSVDQGAHGPEVGQEISEELESGPLGGPMSPLAPGCALAPGLDHGAFEQEDPPRDHENIAVDGEVVAYDSYGCVIVEDFATGLQRTIPLETALDPLYSEERSYLPPARRVDYSVETSGWETKLRVAGGLLAYRANPSGGGGQGSVVVYDIDKGAAVYSVPLPRDDRFALDLPLLGPTFDLEADGTLVIADPRTCTATVSTPVEPAPRPFGIPVCAVRKVLDGRALVLVPGAHARRTLAWTPLEDPQVHPVAELGTYGALEATPSTMNETDAVYALGSCWGAHVYRTALAAPGTPPNPPASCPVQIPEGHATVTSRRLSLRIRCPLGCEGYLDVGLGTLSTVRQAFEEQGSVALAVAPGRPKTLTVMPEEGGDYLLREPSELVREERAGHREYLALEFDVATPSALGICHDCDLFGGPSFGEPEDVTDGVKYARRTRMIVPIELARP